MSGDILGDDERLLASLLAVRSEIEVQEQRLAEGYRSLESLPHRRPYLLLVLDLGERLLAAQRAWLDEVERVLGPG